MTTITMMIYSDGKYYNDGGKINDSNYNNDDGGRGNDKSGIAMAMMIDVV